VTSVCVELKQQQKIYKITEKMRKIEVSTKKIAEYITKALNTIVNHLNIVNTEIRLAFQSLVRTSRYQWAHVVRLVQNYF